MGVCSGDTATHLAVLKSNTETVRLLKDMGSSFDARDLQELQSHASVQIRPEFYNLLGADSAAAATAASVHAPGPASVPATGAGASDAEPVPAAATVASDSASASASATPSHPSPKARGASSPMRSRPTLERVASSNRPKPAPLSPNASTAMTAPASTSASASASASASSSAPINSSVGSAVASAPAPTVMVGAGAHAVLSEQQISVQRAALAYVKSGDVASLERLLTHAPSHAALLSVVQHSASASSSATASAVGFAGEAVVDSDGGSELLQSAAWYGHEPIVLSVLNAGLPFTAIQLRAALGVAVRRAQWEAALYLFDAVDERLTKSDPPTAGGPAGAVVVLQPSPLSTSASTSASASSSLPASAPPPTGSAAQRLVVRREYVLFQCLVQRKSTQLLAALQAHDAGFINRFCSAQPALFADFDLSAVLLPAPMDPSGPPERSPERSGLTDDALRLRVVSAIIACPDRNGRNALFAAVTCHASAAVMQALLGAAQVGAASPQAFAELIAHTDRFGKTALLVACQLAVPTAVQFALMAHGASLALPALMQLIVPPTVSPAAPLHPALPTTTNLRQPFKLLRAVLTLNPDSELRLSPAQLHSVLRRIDLTQKQYDPQPLRTGQPATATVPEDALPANTSIPVPTAAGTEPLSLPSPSIIPHALPAGPDAPTVLSRILQATAMDDWIEIVSRCLARAASDSAASITAPIAAYGTLKDWIK